MGTHRSLLAMIFVFLSLPLAAYNELELNVHVKLLAQAAPPEIWQDVIILTFQSDTPVYVVNARFDHEQYKVLHTYQRNLNNVYFLVLPLPEKRDMIRYRVSVDGLWMPDRFNPEQVTDRLGVAHSLIRLPVIDYVTVESPLVLGNGLVSFNFKAPEKRHVYLAGDFNNWDPFRHKLQPDPARPGVYTITLKLKPGRHVYCYFLNGERRTDLANMDVLLDGDGKEVSVFDLPG